MTQQEIEHRLNIETRKNIHRIIRFIRESEKYQHQEQLLRALRGMVNQKHKLASKGSTAKERTLLSLKIAIAHLGQEGFNTTSHDESIIQKEKVMLMNYCMERLKSHVSTIPEDLIGENINDYLTDTDRYSLFESSPRLFKSAMIKRLLSAIFMGEEDVAAKIVRTSPELLFEHSTYKMPLLNEDGTISKESEQIYYNVTPLQLMFYTGDWKLEARVLPLIPEEKLEPTIQEKKNILLGGPDVVKIDRDPTKLSIDELRHYHVKDERQR